MRLPPPIRYEELQRETMSAPLHSDGMTSMHCGCLHQEAGILALISSSSCCAVALKPEIFEGLRFDFTKPLNQNFALCHRYAHCLWYTMPVHESSLISLLSVACNQYWVIDVKCCCSIFMGNIDVPTQNNQPLKMPMGTYEFGANLVSSKVRPIETSAQRCMAPTLQSLHRQGSILTCGNLHIVCCLSAG